MMFEKMKRKVASVRNISEISPTEDLEYWLSRDPSERIAAVEFLRTQFHGNTERIQRTVRIIQQT